MNSRSSRMMQELQNEELLQSREDLLASLARYTDLFELAPLGYLVLGPDGTIRQLNSAAASLLNIDPSQVPELPFTAFVAAADRPALEACLRLVFDTRTEQACEVALEQGAPVPCFVRIEAKFSERRQACYAAFLDITDRKQAEMQIRHAQTLLLSITEGNSDDIYVKDCRGRYLMFNSAAAQITGRPVEDVLGQDDRFLFTPDDADRVMELDRRIMDTGVMETTEEVVSLAGEPEVFLTTKGPVWDPQNYVVGLFGIARNITERKRAEQEIRQQALRLHDLSRQLMTVQETERRHLARELHDEIGQMLTAIHIGLQQLKGTADSAAVPRLEENIAIVNQAIHQLPQLALNLRPAMLDDFGLEAALRWYVDREQPRLGCEVRFVAESSGTRLPPELNNTCFRVAQEALTNVLRHARAQRIWVELRQHEETVEVVVRDDGVGFDLAAAYRRAAEGGSLGLIGMQERVQLLGGRFDIESNLGQGTTVRVRLRVPASEDEAAEKSDS